MQFSGTISLDKVCWVKQEKEEKAISIVIDNDGDELTLLIKRKQLERLKNLADEFLKGEVRPAGEENGSFDVCLLLDGEKVSIDLARHEVLPFPSMLVMKDAKGEEFRLFIDGSQARAIQEKLEPFIRADEEFSKIKDTPSLND